ncbi:MAG TPA: hypothetical protein VIF64_23115 [Pyrinomonadaceae bacterium]
MRRREYLMVIALLTVGLVSAKANGPGVSKTASPGEQAPASEVDVKTDAEANPVELPTAEVSPLMSRDHELSAAYLKALRILSGANGCSHFFGGPALSVGVFKQLFGKVQKDFIPTSIGIQMSGGTTNFRNAVTRTEYRLFDRVTINANGPFYRSHVSLASPSLHQIGTFEPNTQEARVLMLLHELGHVIKGDDGNWLLPNDGKDENTSHLNSLKIEHVCGEQIKALRKERKGDGQMNLAGKSDY